MVEDEREFQTLFQSMELGAYLQGADGSMIDVNPAALAMLGVSRETFLAAPRGERGSLLTLEEEEQRSAGPEGAELALQKTEQVRDFVATIKREPDGAAVRVNVRAIPLSGRVLVTMRDVTEQKRFEELARSKDNERERESRQMQMLHAHKLESLGVLVGGIAHDFNNILTSIMGNTDLALMQLAPGTPACDNLRRVEKASRRAADLIKQMLAYSGKGKASPEPIDLNRLLEEMLDMLKAAVSKKVSLRLDLTRPLHRVSADPLQMRQIVMNLVLNASESLGDEVGKIKIATNQAYYDQEELGEFQGGEALAPGFYLSLSVSDTGCGLDEETKIVLDPFFPSLSSGRGLGMAAAAGLVRGLKGGVKLQSDLGMGSTFTVILPAREMPPAALDPAEAASEPLGNGVVLLVDDDEEVCALVGDMLARLGYQVVTARDGRAALEAFLQREDFAFVILDLTMPVMDGEQTYQQLRGIDPAVKVVITSGYDDETVARRFEGKGVKGVLQKPFDMAALRRVIG